MLARVEQRQADEVFKVYVASALQAAPQGRYVSADYWKLSHPAPADPRSGDEIAADVVSRMGLEVV